MKAIKSFYHIIVDNKISTLSGALCFFILLNGGSYLFLFSNIASMIIDVSPLIDKLLEDGIIKDIFLYLLRYNSNLNISIVLLIGSLYSSSSLYYHFIHIAEAITKIPINIKFGKRILSLILVLIVLIAIFVFVMGLIILESINKVLFYLFLLVGYLLIIIFLNKLILKNKSLFNGILFSFIYGIVFTILFILYINIFSSFKIVYGVLSFIIVFLFYLYIMTIGLLMGIYINCKNLDVFNLLSIP